MDHHDFTAIHVALHVIIFLLVHLGGERGEPRR